MVMTTALKAKLGLLERNRLPSVEMVLLHSPALLRGGMSETGRRMSIPSK